MVSAWWVWVSQAWEGEEGTQHGAHHRQPARMARRPEKTGGREAGPGGSCGRPAPCVQVAACAALPPLPRTHAQSQPCIFRSGSKFWDIHCPGLGRQKRTVSSRPPEPQGPLPHLPDIHLFPDENMMATAEDPVTSMRTSLLQSCAAQEKVLGGPS